MNKLIQSLFFTLFFASFNTNPMSRLLTAKSALGRTHFIRGVHYNRPFSTNVNHNTKLSMPLAKQQLPIINGSSTHLIDETRSIQSFFSSVHNISSIILHLLDNAEKDITIAMFSLTDAGVADALINAHKRGVAVEIMMEPSNMKQYSKCAKLIKNNILVYQYDPSKCPHYNPKNKYDSIMHHKCFVIDGNILVTGSANSTNAAYKYNIENIDVIRDLLTIQEHQEEFKRLKTYCTQCTK